MAIRRHPDGREEWLGVWLNELHGDYLAHERITRRCAEAAREALVAASRTTPVGGPWRQLAASVVRAVRLLL